MLNIIVLKQELVRYNSDNTTLLDYLLDNELLYMFNIDTNNNLCTLKTPIGQYVFKLEEGIDFCSSNLSLLKDKLLIAARNSEGSTAKGLVNALLQ